MSKVAGGIIGGLIGIPGSYFFQNELVRTKCGGMGGYLSKLPEMISDKGASEMGIPQNLFLGIAVFAVAGVLLAFIIGKMTEKK